MSHKPTVLETIRLLLGLLPNHYPELCPCNHYRCRCHQQWSAQIDTTVKQHIPQRATSSGLSRTTWSHTKGRSPNIPQERLRDISPIERPRILDTRDCLETSTTIRKTTHQKRNLSPEKKGINLQKKNQSLMMITRKHYHRKDSLKPRKRILLEESSRLSS